MELYNVKSLSAFYQAAEAVKADFSEERLTELIETFDDVIVEDLLTDFENSEKLVAKLPLEFYDNVAANFEFNLNNHPEFWMIHNSLLHQVFDEETTEYIINKISENAPGTNAEYIYKGELALANNSPGLAMIYFNQVDHYLANIYKGYCYMELENYPNAIKNFKLFLKGLDAFLENPILPGVEDNQTLKTYRWDAYNELVYLYNKTRHYDLAIESFKESLKIYDIDSVHSFLLPERDDSTIFSDFENYVNNYLYALQKTQDYEMAAEFLKRALHLFSDSIFYKKRLKELKARIEGHKYADEILKNVIRVKRPYNIKAFKKSQALARERVLEDMILEQIKYGFMVFGKKLELYQDERLDGRQYHIGNGIIDLLLVDKSSDILYVVELKRGLAGAEVIDQIEGYMDGISQEIDKTIKGIICIHQASSELTKLVKAKDDIELYTYHFDFKKLG